MKRKITTIKRMLSFGLVLTMMLTGMNVYAAEGEANPADSVDELKTVSYNMETGEITYEVHKVEDLPDVSSLEIQNDEYGINPLYDGIIGLDNRVRITNTTDSPYRNVCYVEAKFPDGSISRGSGVLVYFDVLLTCGHCVYLHDHGGFATSIKIIPAMNGENNAPLGTAYSLGANVCQAWVDNKDTNGDWAIVDLNKSFQTWQLFGYYSNIYSQLGTSVTSIGYPRDEGFKGYMYADTNSISYVTEYRYTVLCDMTGGQSGGALIDDKSGYLIGINNEVREIKPGEEYANYCVRLTPELCSLIQEHYD